MQWKGRRQSENIEDRGSGGGGISRGGLAVGGGGAGVLILVVVLSLISGQDPGQILQDLQQGQPGAVQGPQGEQPLDPADAETMEFLAVVLADTEDVWNEQLPKQLGKQYREPTLVRFRGQVESACGNADAAVGPFYCPGDQKLYLDLEFFDELKRRFGAPGDFAQAYVVAHEVGHHVQTLLGLTQQVDAQRGRLSKVENNRLSVRLELQADFLAGVWAHHAQKTKQILEPGDLDEAFNAAQAIGDDTLQRKGQGRVVPDSFTHGTSEQRKRWFRKGFETGDLKQMNATFDLPDNQL